MRQATQPSGRSRHPFDGCTQAWTARPGYESRGGWLRAPRPSGLLPRANQPWPVMSCPDGRPVATKNSPRRPRTTGRPALGPGRPSLSLTRCTGPATAARPASPTRSTTSSAAVPTSRPDWPGSPAPTPRSPTWPPAHDPYDSGRLASRPSRGVARDHTCLGSTGPTSAKAPYEPQEEDRHRSHRRALRSTLRGRDDRRR